MQAVRKSKVTVVKVLLAHKANVDPIDKVVS